MTTGDGVELNTGSLVALEPILSCGHCSHCQTGYYNRCSEAGILGARGGPGGMAEYMVAPAKLLHPLPGEVASHIAALSEPMAVGVRGVRLGGVTLGQSIAILGAGSIGLLAIPAAFAAGAAEVFITAKYPYQAEIARHLGATQVFQSSDDLLKEIGEDGIEVVVETVGGHADTLQEAVGIARPGATIVILGLFGGSPSIPGRPFVRKELTLVGSFCYGQGIRQRDFDITTQLIHRFQTELEPVVTHRFKLDEVG